MIERIDASSLPSEWEAETAEEFRARRKARRHARALERQRARRTSHRRMDYYPSAEAQAVILARVGPGVNGCLSAIINRLVLAAAAVETDAS